LKIAYINRIILQGLPSLPQHEWNECTSSFTHSYIVLLLTTESKGPKALPRSKAVMEQHTVYFFSGIEGRGGHTAARTNLPLLTEIPLQQKPCAIHPCSKGYRL
jgi:hypothetical protein